MFFKPRFPVASFDLDPHRVLAAIGQRRDELPLARAHAGGLRVEVEVPLAAGETELVACSCR